MLDAGIIDIAGSKQESGSKEDGHCFREAERDRWQIDTRLNTPLTLICPERNLEVALKVTEVAVRLPGTNAAILSYLRGTYALRVVVEDVDDIKETRCSVILTTFHGFPYP